MVDLEFCTAHDEECDPCRWRRVTNLHIGLETAAALTLTHQTGYAKGAADILLLQSFCSPGGVDYAPMADSRPTAERTAWKFEDMEDVCPAGCPASTTCGWCK